jgi:CheY-like chemotaxis protein
MKRILTVNFPDFLAEFLKAKLAWEDIEVESPVNNRDAYLPLVTSLPDLVLVSVVSAFSEVWDFLRRKQEHLSARRIPVFILGPSLPPDKIALLRQYGVINYFTKPVPFDTLIAAIAQLLNTPIALDPTPCTIEVRCTDACVYVAISQGLNYDKIPLLRLRLNELFDQSGEKKQGLPKIVVEIKGLSFTFLDGINLEQLMDNITPVKSRLPANNSTIVSGDAFVRDFIAGHPQYTGIEVRTDLPDGSSAPDKKPNDAAYFMDLRFSRS